MIEKRNFGFSLYYFFFFSFVAVFMPFFSLYLSYLDFSYIQIGFLISIGSVIKVFCPYFLGRFADITGNGVNILCFLSLLLFVLFFFTYFNLGFIEYILFLLFFQFFCSGIMPVVESETLKFLNEKKNFYGVIRVWGSVGFMITVFIAGFIIDIYSIKIFLILAHLPLFLLLISSLMLIKESENKTKNKFKNDKKITIDKKMIVFLIGVFFMQLSHGSYNTFFSVYLAENDYSNRYIGFFWVVAVFFEILIFIFSPLFLKNKYMLNLIIISVFSAIFRFLFMSFFVQNTFILFFCQFLHSLTFGLFHICAVLMINKCFSNEFKSRGQALFSSVGYGLGGGLGALISGLVWNFEGGNVSFIISSFFAFCSFIIFLLYKQYLD